MFRRIRSILAIVCVVALFAAIRPVGPAFAGIEPGPGNGWLTIASRSNPEDAIAMARQYAARFPTAVVFGSSNGYFAVTLGWANISEGRSLLQRLVGSGDVPADSYYTAGKRFIRAIWSASNAQDYALSEFYVVTRLQLHGYDQGAAAPRASGSAGQSMQARPARVVGLDATGDNFLSLRAGPGTANAEIARMRANTRVTITGESGGWYQVSLSNGMRGWAFGKYLAFEDIPVVGPDAVPTIGPETELADKAGQPVDDAGRDAEVAAVQPDTEAAVVRDPPKLAISDQKRVALVLGNSEYVSTTVLPNPKNDAAAIAAKLKALGFEVVSGLDGTKAEMEKSIREFVRILSGSDVALFFYAGHAMQVNGRNYMIPVDAKLEDSTAIDFETIDLGVVLDFMNNNNRISIALLDACRDNPLSRRFARSFGSTRSAFIGRGVAAPATGAGEMLIGFATAPGEVALDGDGDNSPFTTALLRHIETKGLDVELMLKRVRQDVYELTDESQEPWVNSALRREFQFNPE